MDRTKLYVFCLAAVAMLGIQLLAARLVQQTEVLYWCFPLLALLTAGTGQALLRFRLVSAGITALIFVTGSWLLFPGNKLLWAAVFIIISFKAALVVDLWLLVSNKPR